jgi:transcription elongation factor Elf1
LAQRLPEGFRCPACGHDKGWELDRARLAVIADHSAATLGAFVATNVAKASAVVSDGRPGGACPPGA